MSVAVITDAVGADVIVDPCIRSVREQSLPADHWIVIAEDQKMVDVEGVRFLRLPRLPPERRPAYRSLAAIYAISAGCDALTFLDQDHWYDPSHLSRLRDLAKSSGACIVTSNRSLANARDGSQLRPTDREFSNASSWMLTRDAFGLVGYWFLLPAGQNRDIDVWPALRASELRWSHLNETTVYFSSDFARVPVNDGRGMISLCMIAQNSAETLRECLSSVADLVDEIILVDTGSSDSTREIARSFQAKVINFPWTDSFADARNEALRHAKGEWIVSLDADDSFDQENRVRLRDVLARRKTKTAYLFTQRSRIGPDWSENRLVGLFPNLPNIEWKYRIHEQILPSLQRQSVCVMATSIRLSHRGYEDPLRVAQKKQRNLRLAEIEYQELPNDPIARFHFAQCCADTDRVHEAIELFNRVLAECRPGSSLQYQTFRWLIQCHQSTGPQEDVHRVYENARRYFPQDPHFFAAKSW